MGERLFAIAPATLFLVDDGLTKLDTFATDENITRTLDKRPHIAEAFSAERAESVAIAGVGGGGFLPTGSRVFGCHEFSFKGKRVHKSLNQKADQYRGRFPG